MRGYDAELKFKEFMFKYYSVTCIPSSVNDNIFKHWDFIIYGFFTKYFKKNKYTIDVKSVKSIKRGESLQDEYHWIELQNRNGDCGWYNAEELDGIVFETFNEWILVDRKMLKTYIDSSIIDEYTNDPFNAHYIKYTRFGNDDILTLIPTSILRDMSAIIFFKNGENYIVNVKNITK